MKTKLIYSIVIVMFMFGLAFSASAQTGKDYNSSISNSGAIAEEELVDAGLTPDSPFHFMDRFGDWVRVNVFTFNKVRKAEIKAEIAEERLAELKVVVDSESAEDVIAKAEALASASSEDVEGDLEQLSGEGRDIANLLEKFNDLSLKQQSVLERVLDKAPEQAKERLAHALEVSNRGFVKVDEVLQKQLQEGRIDQEKAKEILEKRVEKFKDQIERRSEHLAQFEEELGEVPPEVKERFEEKLGLLEEQLLNVESKEEFKEVREAVREHIKDAAISVRAFRVRHELKDEDAEEILEDIAEGNLDVQAKAAEMIREAEEEMIKIREHLAKAQEKGIEVRENIKSLYDNAVNYLKNAKTAFEQKKYGEAFGQAIAARHNIKNAIRALEPLLEGENGIREKIHEAKEELSEFEAEVKEFRERLGKVPEAVERILLAAREQLKKAEELLSKGELRRALAHAQSVEKMAEHGKNLLERLEEVGDVGGETEDFKNLEERAKAQLRQIREEKEDELKELRPEIRTIIKPRAENTDETDTRLCAQVLTPARNVSTRVCRIFSNSCIPEGWKVDKECAKVDIKPSVDSAGTLSPDANVGVNAASVAQVHRVKITADGFFPRELEIKKGDTVVWINDSDRASWPASAVHPTHTILPGFDALRGLKHGESYKFQFKEAGIWKYHDHLRPTMTGAIVVE